MVRIAVSIEETFGSSFYVDLMAAYDNISDFLSRSSETVFQVLTPVNALI